jgi:hypothetical protein
MNGGDPASRHRPIGMRLEKPPARAQRAPSSLQAFEPAIAGKVL